MTEFKIESLLAARLFLSPQLAGDRLYFISNLSGRLSLYAMDRAGSVPEPLLPPDISLMTPEMVGPIPFYVFPKLGKVIVMIDRDGDENYQPFTVPLEGGFPEPLFGDRFAGMQLTLSHCDPERNRFFLGVDPRRNPNMESYLVDLETGELTFLGTSIYGNQVAGVSDDYARVALADGYTSGDHVLYLWERGQEGRRLLYGKPIEQRAEGEEVPLNALGACNFTPGGGLLCFTVLFDDRYGLGYLPLGDPAAIRPVMVVGTVHTGDGELEDIEHLQGDRYLLRYNIDGCTWAYEGSFDEAHDRMTLDRVICGQGALANGVAQSIRYDKLSGDYALAFSTATSPAQIFTVTPATGTDDAPDVTQLTRERVLGIPGHLLAPGEDASFTSHDGLRISARLYLPAPELGFAGPRPVIFYIHGGPQSQERPDFTWFSMPLIQFFTLNGFAVFVPNVRGSHGYGMDYMKRVDRDWGGLDRLDHVAAHAHLHSDDRLDMTRVGVMGRSYGGYMTLMLTGRHPELWQASCDMFGPYNLLTFLERIPETWKTYFYLALGHPEHDRDFLIERSPSTYLHQLACPMLVIQGRNDPRVRAGESEDVVKDLRAQGKEIDFLVFENEGHDVTRYENKLRCYSEIVEFFKRRLTG